MEPGIRRDSGGADLFKNGKRRPTKELEVQTSAPARIPATIAQQLSVAGSLDSFFAGRRRRFRIAATTRNTRFAIQKTYTFSVEFCIWTCRSHGWSCRRQCGGLVAH